MPPPPQPSFSTVSSKATRSREDFPINDLDQLLRAVIEVNPYIASRNKTAEKWREVAKRVQDAGYCKGRDPDTLKHKVINLLHWVEVCTAESKHLTFADLCPRMAKSSHHGLP
jgi:hypothetical protein